MHALCVELSITNTFFGSEIMQSIQVNWEDEENNRVVELSVQYRLDAGSVAISGVTPNRVHFLCPNTGSALRP
jgi:hypothetical protein